MTRMYICDRCDNEFKKTGIPDLIISETMPCGGCCSGYDTYELTLCPDCTEALKKFMNMGVEKKANGTEDVRR